MRFGGKAFITTINRGENLREKKAIHITSVLAAEVLIV
jgi:hypothetical protein